MSKQMFMLLLSSLALLTLLLSAPSVQADPPPTPTLKDSVQALQAKVQAQDSVRVIVGLRTPFQPEGNLRIQSEVKAQHVATRQAQDALLNSLAGQNVASVKRFTYIPYLALKVDEATLSQLASSSQVASIQEDTLLRPTLAESVPLIGAPAAWTSGYTGSGQVIAILDTGVDKIHPFLAGKVVSEACYSTTDPSDGATSVCPGGVAESIAPGSGVPCGVNCEHGTHVAGIAVGHDNGSIGFNGVAKDAKLIAIQVFSRFGSDVFAYDSDIMSGLERVQTLASGLNIASVNLSLGGGMYTSYCDSDPLKPAIDNLRSLNIATVIASGNNSYTNALSSPGCISTAVSVGSTNDGSDGTIADTISSFSNSASFLKLLAPGMWIKSSVPGGGYETWAGTSMATPHVAGAWAVLKSENPSASVDAVLSALTSTGNPIKDNRNNITKPRIRVDAAAAALKPNDNDDFDNATAINQMPYNISESTSMATLANDDPTFACVVTKGKASAWFKFTPATNGMLRINTTGSSYDTILAVWQGTRGNLNSVACNDNTSTQRTSSLSANLSAGTTYYLEVAGKVAGGLLKLAATFTPKIPAAVKLHSPTNNSQSTDPTRVLDWTDVPDAAYYQVEIRKGSDTGTVVISAKPTDSTYTTGNLVASRYYWRVRACNIVNRCSAWTTFWNFYVLTPTRPTLLTPTNSSTTSGNVVTLDWSDSAGATYYQVQIRQDTTAGTLVQASNPTSELITPTLQSGHWYYWRVQACSPAGCSVRTAWWKFKIP